MAQSSSASTSNNVANTSISDAADEDYSIFKPISKLEVKFRKKNLPRRISQNFLIFLSRELME